jgi:hypothetical protein
VENPSPCGSHPALDPLWSTEQLSVIYDGGDTGRRAKIDFISDDPLALETLRICYQDPPTVYNCGRCWKCLSTMIGLELSGALERCTRLPRKVDPEWVRRAELEPEHRASSLERLLEEARSRGASPELVEALEARVAEVVAKRPDTLDETEHLLMRVERLGPLQAEVTRLRSAMEGQTLWAQQAVRDVEQRDATIRELQRQLAEQTAWAQRSVREVAERDAQIRELQAALGRGQPAASSTDPATLGLPAALARVRRWLARRASVV